MKNFIIRCTYSAILLAACMGSAHSVMAASVDAVCLLPRDLQRSIEDKFHGVRPVNLNDLNEYDRKLFTKEHKNNCPGAVRVNFYGDNRPTWALILLSEYDVTHKVKLVLAHQNKSAWSIALLDTAENATPVVWAEAPGKFRDVYGGKTISAKWPVVVFCGYESWAIVYAWTGRGIEKVWISD